MVGNERVALRLGVRVELLVRPGERVWLTSSESDPDRLDIDLVMESSSDDEWEKDRLSVCDRVKVGVLVRGLLSVGVEVLLKLEERVMERCSVPVWVNPESEKLSERVWLSLPVSVELFVILLDRDRVMLSSAVSLGVAVNSSEGVLGDTEIDPLGVPDIVSGRDRVFPVLLRETEMDWDTGSVTVPDLVSGGVRVLVMDKVWERETSSVKDAEKDGLSERLAVDVAVRVQDNEKDRVGFMDLDRVLILD